MTLIMVAGRTTTSHSDVVNKVQIAAHRERRALADKPPDWSRWVSAGRAMAEPLLAALALVAVVTCAQLNPAVPVPERDALSLPTAPPGVGTAGSSALPLEPRHGATSGVAAVASRQENVAEESQALQRFAQAFSNLAQGKRDEPLRVLWFGDSHTAADYLPNTVRKRLSEQGALGGPGYISLGVPGYRHSLVKAWAEGNIELAPHPPARRTREDDGVFGLGGTRITLRDTTALVTVKPVADLRGIPLVFELTYRLVDDLDALHVTLGEQRVELTHASATPMVSGLRQQRFEGKGESSFEVRAGRGRPQVFGVAIERQLPGLVIDTLGINGARFGTLLSWQEDAMALLVQQRHPALIITAYGTNEVFDPEPVGRHAKEMKTVVERLRRAAPEADCIVIGPTDATKGGESTRARVVAIDAAERAIAEQTSCAYFSPYELMASEGGFEAWARQEPPLAVSDGIHLTARGYGRIGDGLADLLLKGTTQR